MGGEKREAEGRVCGKVEGGRERDGGEGRRGEGGREEEGERMLCCSVEFLKHFYCSKRPLHLPLCKY